jgi:hypothetical protein
MIGKKALLLVLTLMLGEGVFAENGGDFSLSAGIGGTVYSRLALERMDATFATPSIGGGVGTFFDATYAELSVDLLWGSQLPPIYPDDTASGSISLTHTGFSLYGKYPFTLKKFTLYPLLGIEYHLFSSAHVKNADGNYYGVKIKRGDDIGGYNAEDRFDFLSLGTGVGVDVQLPQSFFIRSEIILNYTFNSKVEKDKRKAAKEYGFDFLSVVFGARVKLAVGYRFR